MNLSNKLDQFRHDNPYDINTQAKRLIATKDDALILHVIELGLTLAKQRERHDEREHIKATGFARPQEKLVIKPGRVTGSVVIEPSKRFRNAVQKLVMDTWKVNGEQRLGDATAADLGAAIKRETMSANGHKKNAEFYKILREPLMGSTQTVREKWTDDSIRPRIKAVYGEFRKSEAA